MTKPPTIAFFPEASFGAALNCVGIAQKLKDKGANPVFICHAGFTGIFAEYGFREYHLTQNAANNAGAIEDYWQEFINTHVPHFNLNPLDQLHAYITPTWEAIVDTVITAEEELTTILERIAPDAVVLDNVVMFPAIAKARCPWIRIVSCAETEIPDPNVPPYLSGLSPEDAAACKTFERAYLQQTRQVHRRYNDFRKTNGLQGLPPGIFLETSPTLNLLLSPDPVRYDRQHPLPADKFTYLEGCVRIENAYELPRFPASVGPLVYTSFGSLGAIDTDLIKRMIEVFATIPARFLVNVGGFLEAYDDVPDNVHLSGWFPQPSVVEQAALFIHHGGNNSFCEALYHGLPSLILPYCWDGHDNAQRAEAIGLGRRINRNEWSNELLRYEISVLLNDKKMRHRLTDISKQMRDNSGTEKAALAILKAVRLGEQVNTVGAVLSD